MLSYRDEITSVIIMVACKKVDKIIVRAERLAGHWQVVVGDAAEEEVMRHMSIRYVVVQVVDTEAVAAIHRFKRSVTAGATAGAHGQF